MTTRMNFLLAMLISAVPFVAVPPLLAQQAIQKDATAKIGQTKLKQGANLVDRSGGISLYVRATPGRPLQYQIRDAKGRMVNAKMDKKGTTCWACGVDASGNTHCWQVPCPDIVGPWTPGKATLQ